MNHENQITTGLPDPGLILLTGATGYVGGRLLVALEKEEGVL